MVQRERQKRSREENREGIISKWVCFEILCMMKRVLPGKKVYKHQCNSTSSSHTQNSNRSSHSTHKPNTPTNTHINRMRHPIPSFCPPINNPLCPNPSPSRPYPIQPRFFVPPSEPHWNQHNHHHVSLNILPLHNLRPASDPTPPRPHAVPPAAQ